MGSIRDGNFLTGSVSMVEDNVPDRWIVIRWLVGWLVSSA